MYKEIERLLRLTADYHNFCNDEFAPEKESDEDELCLSELDTVAAAAGRIQDDIKGKEF